jgi:hypothetical protein
MESKRNMKMAVFYDVAPRSLVTMEAVSSTEMSLNIYQTTGHCIPENRHENLKIIPREINLVIPKV